MSQITVDIYPDMPEDAKNEIIQKAVEGAAEILLRTFMMCNLQTNIETTVINDATGFKYNLSFTKIDE